MAGCHGDGVAGGCGMWRATLNVARFVFVIRCTTHTYWIERETIFVLDKTFGSRLMVSVGRWRNGEGAPCTIQDN